MLSHTALNVLTFHSPLLPTATALLYVALHDAQLRAQAPAAPAQASASGWDAFLHLFSDSFSAEPAAPAPSAQYAAVASDEPASDDLYRATGIEMPAHDPCPELTAARAVLHVGGASSPVSLDWFARALAAPSAPAPSFSQFAASAPSDAPGLALLHVVLALYSHALIVVDDDAFATHACPLGPLPVLSSWVALVKLAAFHLVWCHAPTPLLDACHTWLRAMYRRDRRFQFVRDGWHLPPQLLTRWRARFHLAPPDARAVSLLHRLPFLVPFAERVLLFRTWAHTQQAAWLQVHAESTIQIRRRLLVADGLAAVQRLGARLNGRLRVQFLNDQDVPEDGVDLGGPFKEFLEQLCQRLLTHDYGLFVATADSKALFPNPAGAWLHPDFTSIMETIGKLLGKALVEGILVDVNFAPHFLARVLGRPAALSELQHVDATLYKNLLFVKHYQADPAELCLTFTIQDESRLGDGSALVDLCAGGAGRDVTRDTVLPYVFAVADYHLNRKIRAASAAIARGLSLSLDARWLSIFHEHELQVLLSGAADQAIDVDDWERHTVYDDRGGLGAHADHKVVRRFWRAVRALSAPQRSALLRFVTAISRPPLAGFAHLRPPFMIRLVPFVEAPGAPGRSFWDSVVSVFSDAPAVPVAGTLPSAATCFNLLKLPLYPSFAIMQEKLLRAIDNSTGFGLA